MIVPTAAAASREFRHSRVMTALIARTTAPQSDLGHSGIFQRRLSKGKCRSSKSHRSRLACPLHVRPMRKARRRAKSRSNSDAGICNLPHLAHEHQRQSRTHRNQQRPDKQFKPIDRGDVARPQIIPAGHVGKSPLPVAPPRNAEPRLWFQGGRNKCLDAANVAERLARPTIARVARAYSKPGARRVT